MALAEDGRNTVILITVLFVAATFITVARLLIRRKSEYGPDDYVLCVSLIMLWAQAGGGYTLALKGGEGKHIEYLTSDEKTWLFKALVWSELGYTMLAVAVKTSILYSYKRIFRPMVKVTTYIHILLGLSWAWGVATFFGYLFQCYPVAKTWDPTREGSCIDIVMFLWGNSVSNFILDWLILLVPAVPVWKLNMDITQKAFLGGSFALGSVACVASTVRSAKTTTYHVNDVSGTVFASSIWTFIEPSLGIISACLPFFSRLCGSKVSSALNHLSTLALKTLAFLSLGKAELYKPESQDSQHIVPEQHRRNKSMTATSEENSGLSAQASRREVNGYPTSTTGGHRYPEVVSMQELV